MRAIVLHDHGDVDRLTEADLPTPTAGPGEVRVKVHAVALNHLDLWVRRGLPGLKLEYPHILGSDIAGELDDGTRVIVSNPGISCMKCRACLTGRDNLCRKYGILGEHLRGGYAEYIVIPHHNVLPWPAGLSAAEAASLPLTLLTAWQMLVDKARVRPGEDVVVLGASAGVGVAAVQIAKLHGARVIATSRDEAKRARLLELGADHVIPTEGFPDEVRKLTGKKGADVIVEHVGQATWADSIKAVTNGGRIVTCGSTSGWDARTDLRHVFFRQISILGSTMGPKGTLFEILDHVAAGRIKPVVDRTFPLAQARDAHRHLESSSQFGKVVLVTGAG